MENKINKLIEQNELLLNKINKLEQIVLENKRNSNEIIYANTFSDTINNSNWLIDKTFSPGRWAIGYAALYCIYRVLNEFKPKKLLEIGLGQSTKMITQYAMSNSDIEHFVVENDPNWIDFFKNDNSVSNNTKIINLDYEMKSYKNVQNVRTYKGFAEKFKDEKLDFIFIDAPLCGDMPVIGRIDVLSIAPECLADSFVILVDDCNRIAEQRMVGELQSKLKEANIKFTIGVYSGAKDFVIICSENNSFLTSM